MANDCTYCGQDVTDHDPVYVQERAGDDRVETGRFCNYACLASYVEEEALATGASCEWSPD